MYLFPVPSRGPKRVAGACKQLHGSVRPRIESFRVRHAVSQMSLFFTNGLFRHQQTRVFVDIGN